MATVNATNYAKFINPTQDNILEPGQYHGRVRVIQDSYTLAALPIGDSIKVGKIPKNARYLGHHLAHAALGTATTLEIGDSGLSTRFMSAKATAAAGFQTEVNVGGMNFKFTADTEILVKLAGGVGTGAIETAVFYTMD